MALSHVDSTINIVIYVIIICIYTYKLLFLPTWPQNGWFIDWVKAVHPTEHSKSIWRCTTVVKNAAVVKQEKLQLHNVAYSKNKYVINLQKNTAI